MAGKPLLELSRLAPTLKEAELRVLIYLTAEATATASTTVQTSSRDIARACKLSRSNVMPAIDSLTTRGLIATRQGTATRAAAYMLRFLEVTTLGGPVTGPPRANPGPTAGPPLDLNQGHPGPVTGPPPTENAGLLPTPSRLDINPDSIVLLDRVLTARSSQKPRDLLQQFAATLRTYAPRLGRVYDRDPDADTCAQLLEACGDRHETLSWLVIQLKNAHTQPGESPMWWVTVALQRVHGIPPKITAARREELKLAKRPNLVRDRQRAAQQAAADEDALHEVQALHEGLAAAAAAKRMP